MHQTSAKFGSVVEDFFLYIMHTSSNIRTWETQEVELFHFRHYPPTADLSKAPELITIIAGKMSLSKAALLLSCATQFSARKLLAGCLIIVPSNCQFATNFPNNETPFLYNEGKKPNWENCPSSVLRFLANDDTSILHTRKSVKTAVNHKKTRLLQRVHSRAIFTASISKRQWSERAKTFERTSL